MGSRKGEVASGKDLEPPSFLLLESSLKYPYVYSFFLGWCYSWMFSFPGSSLPRIVVFVDFRPIFLFTTS